MMASIIGESWGRFLVGGGRGIWMGSANAGCSFPTGKGKRVVFLAMH